MGNNINDYLPDKSIVCSNYHLDLFYYWIYARQEIWYRRFILRLPPEKWSSDPILIQNKFTNCYRELDRNTVWYLKNIAHKHVVDYETLIMNIFIFRLINNPVTFEKAGLPSSIKQWPEYKEHLLNVMDSMKENPFTNAYFIHPTPGYTRNKAYTHLVLQSIYENIESICNSVRYGTPEEMCAEFTKYRSIGEFIAYELYCDIVHTGTISYDFDSYVNIGPGCATGMSYVYPITQGFEITNEIRKRFIEILRDSAPYHFKRLGYNFKFVHEFNPEKKLNLRVIEHSLCEFSKYMGKMNNVGRARLNFQPKVNPQIERDYLTEYYDSLKILALND